MSKKACFAFRYGRPNTAETEFCSCCLCAGWGVKTPGIHRSPLGFCGNSSIPWDFVGIHQDRPTKQQPLSWWAAFLSYYLGCCCWMFSNRLTWYRTSIMGFLDRGICFFGWYKFSMGNRGGKKFFFKKLTTTTSLALRLCPRSMCDCLVAGWLGTGHL